MCHLAQFHQLRNYFTKSMSKSPLVSTTSTIRTVDLTVFFFKFAYFGKWTKLISGIIWSLFHSKWVASDSRRRTLPSFIGSTPIRQFWNLSYVLSTWSYSFCAVYLFSFINLSKISLGRKKLINLKNDASTNIVVNTSIVGKLHSSNESYTSQL